MSLDSYYRFIKKNPWYECWKSARRRCNDRNHKSFKSHGARGIMFYLTKSDAATLWERDSAHLLVIPSIDRLDPDGHYTFDNCRFIEFTKNCGLARSKWRDSGVADSEIAKVLW